MKVISLVMTSPTGVAFTPVDLYYGQTRLTPSPLMPENQLTAPTLISYFKGQPALQFIGLSLSLTPLSSGQLYHLCLTVKDTSVDPDKLSFHASGGQEVSARTIVDVPEATFALTPATANAAMGAALGALADLLA